MTTNTHLTTNTKVCHSKSIFLLSSNPVCAKTDCPCYKQKKTCLSPFKAPSTGESIPGSSLSARPQAISAADEYFKRGALCLLIGLMAILSSLVGISTGLMLDDYNFSLQAILGMSLPVSILFFLLGFFLCRIVITYVF